METRTVTISRKLYQGATWKTSRVQSVASIQDASRMLGQWSRMYASVETIETGSGAKFWFRDAGDFNLLVIVSGASVNDLRAAYRAA